MNKLFKGFIIVALVSICCSSCKKFLDQEPNSIATDQTTWKSDDDAKASVYACYSLLRSSFNAAITYFSYGDLTSGEFIDIVGGDGSFRDVMNYNWGIGIPAANSYDPRLKLRLYNNFYAAITQANRCLYFIDQMPLSAFEGESDDARTVRKQQYMAQAQFLRAFTYFYISRVWGDVPLITNYSQTLVSDQISRTPTNEVLDQAVADAKAAAAVLSWKNEGSGDRVVTADKGVVNALLAHIYAWRRDYKNCITACDEVINSGTYAYTDSANYMSIYKGQSPETIFEIAQNSTAESMRANDAWSITGVTLTPPYINNGATQPWWQIDGGLIDYLYSDKDDVRFRKALVELTVGGSGRAYECIKYANIQNVNNSTANQIALNNIIVFRLADIKLLKAEALAAANNDDAGALTLVNELRSVRGAAALPAMTGNDMLYAITDERGRELFLEGHRTYDLIRLERLTGEQQFSYITPAQFDQGKYYWPIDPSMFSLNNKLTQTPFWVGKMK